MEPEFSQPMLFQQTDGAAQDPVFDPAQVVGVQSINAKDVSSSCFEGCEIP